MGFDWGRIPSGLVWKVFFLLIGSQFLHAKEGSTGDWSGYVSWQGRGFWQSAQFEGQRDGAVSVAAAPEYYRDWNNGLRAITFALFARLDSTDPERTHADLREAHYLHVAGDWEWRIGLARVFWGVTESQHLVDIINQTDLVENPDAEDKLGQAMIETTWLQDWGAIQFYVLPGFRESTFPGRDGRLRTAWVIDTNEAEYASGAQQYHVDWALRLKAQFGAVDVGLSHFSGTSRTPELRASVRADGDVELIPFYGLIDQSGMDVQAILGNWIWKLEAILQSKKGRDFSAAVGGFEYTFYGVSERGADLGVLMEYHFDDRRQAAASAFQDDLFVGARYVFNDAEDTEVLVGGTYDFDFNSTSFRIELRRRLSEHWKLEGELQWFDGAKEGDLLRAFHRDDYIQLDMSYYF